MRVTGGRCNGHGHLRIFGEMIMVLDMVVLIGFEVRMIPQLTVHMLPQFLSLIRLGRVHSSCSR